MPKKTILRAALWLTSAMALAAPSVAFAQQAGGGGPAIRNDDDIVVTARRREERAQNVPVAVTAMSAQALERQNITNITQINGHFAGVYVTQSPNGSGGQAPFFSIRGQAQQEVVGLIDASVALYLDEVVVGRMNGANLGFFDLQGVEVARGPQGTLFGRNTAGGAVQVHTHAPTDEFEASLAQTIGNYNLRRTDGMLNVPLGENFALRVAGFHNERDGYLTDVITNKDIDYQNDNGARISLSGHLGNVSNLATVSWTQAKDGGTGGFITYAPTGGALVPDLAAQQALHDIYKTYSGVPQFSYVENENFTDILTWELNPHFTIKNVLGYRSIDVHNLQDLDGTQEFYFPVERVISGHQWSEELQLQGNFDRFNFVAGVYWFRENVDDQAFSTGKLTAGGAAFPTWYSEGMDPVIERGHDYDYVTPGGVPNYSDTWGIAENTSYAIFAQGDYHFTDKLSATVGLRQTWDERDAIIRNRAFQPSVSTTGITCRFTLDEDNNPATPETRPSLANCQFHGNADFDELTYNLSLNYQATPDMLLYAATRHGYRPGGFGARAGVQRGGLDQVYKPELVNDVELGIKADWHPGGTFLRTNLAIYYADYKDAQRILQVSQAPPITTAANAQEATIQGAELEILFRPIRQFELSASWAYTDGRFDKFTSPVGVDYSAQDYPHTPKNIYNITGTWHLPVPEDFGPMSLSLSYYHQDEEDTNDYYASPDFTDAGVPTTPTQRAIAIANNAAQILPGHELVNLSFDWDGVFGSNVDLAAFVNNLTEEEYLQPYQGINSQYESRTPGDPRTYGVKLKYNFH